MALQSDKLVQTLESGGIGECEEVLKVFNKQYETAREFPFLTLDEKVKLWKGIFTRLDNYQENSPITTELLNCLKILSREKETLEHVITPSHIKTLLLRSSLSPPSPGPQSLEHLTGMKVIFNMIFQSEKLQSLFISSNLLECLLGNVDTSKNLPPENIHFLLRTFFIITALSKGSGLTVRNELNGLKILIDFTDKMGNNSGPYNSATADILSEALKVLYNLIHNIFPNNVELRADMYDSKEFTLLCELIRLVRRHLVKSCSTLEKKQEVHCHSTHLLCAVPPECFMELLTEDFDDEHDAILFENTDVTAIEAVVQLLDVKLELADKSPSAPILLALSRMATKNRKIRKYLKKRILPALTKEDLRERPEVGGTLRNKLCAVIHNPAGFITEVSANLIFVLCKENVSKMVKYTGYGNAAGLLANRGLMLGGKGDGNYSDSSDESETEDYLEIKHDINYVEGRLKAEEPPIEMSEEQKEYESMKLVQAIEKLSASKIIQPCRIGADGKPQPVESLLELQDSLDNPIKNSRVESDSDSD